MKFSFKSLKNKTDAMSINAKAALVYTLASFITKAFHLLTTPLFTRIMTVEQIGIVSNFSTWQGFISDVVTLGLVSGAINVGLKDYKEDRIGFIKNSQTLILISVLVCGVITGVLFPLIDGVLGMPFHYVILMFVMIYFGASKSFWMSLNRYEYRYKSVGIVTISMSILSALVAVLAVLFAKSKGYEDLSTVRIYASSAITLLFAIPICIKFFANRKAPLKKEYCVFAFTVSAPMIIHTLSKSILSSSDRVMINAIAGAEALGYYSVLYTLASLVLILWDAINASLVPYVFEKLDKGVEQEKKIRKVSAALLLGFAATTVLLLLFAPEIIWLIASKKYLDAIFVMPPIAAGIFYVGVYTLYGNILMYHKKTKWIMLVTTFAAAFNIIANLIFINMFGYVAAAYTTLASYALLAFVYYLCSKKIHGHSIYPDKQIFLIALLLTVFALSCNFLYLNTYIRITAIVVIVAVVFIFRKKLLASYKLIKKKK